MNSSSTHAATEIAISAPTRGQVAATMPAALVIVKPGIVAATVLAGFAGMVVTAHGIPPGETVTATLSSLGLSAAGAAALNSLLEMESDRVMTRLARRREALERFGRNRALLLATGLIAAGLGIALLLLNDSVSFLIVTAVVSYTCHYTTCCKRLSPWGVLAGGIAGAIPPLAGSCAITRGAGIDGILLFVVLFIWQPPHFWALASHFHDDYRSAGIPVMPVARGERVTRRLIFLFAAALLPASLSLSAWGSLSDRFAVAAVGLWGAFMINLYLLIVRRRSYDRAFAASILYVTLLLLAIIMDTCWG
jgi:protoheme IX farnesyltransferase